MSTTTVRRMVVDVPADVYDAFKMECLKNHVTLKDEIYKFLCAALDGAAATEQKKVLVEDLDGEKVETKPEKEVDLKPILGMIEGLTSVTKELQQWREGFRVWQDGKFDALDARALAFDGKMKIVSNFIENNIYFQMKQQGANPCAEDIEGLAVLRSEEVPSTKGLDRDQLKELFKKRMKTKAF